MRTSSLVMGILSICGMFFGFIPCFGAFNWINIPFSIMGLIISVLAYDREDGLPKGNVAAGMVMCAMAIFFGFIRLFLGLGVF
jgi:FtsH-binding integral membrane protein